MKLYTGNQVAFYSVLSGIAAGALFTAGFFFFTDRNSNGENKVASKTIVSTISNAPDKNIREETPVLEVASSSGNYTQDELQNISVYEKWKPNMPTKNVAE